MRAVIYARYSCDNQREESIEGQLRECREFAARKGYTLVGSYIDRAVSAKTDNRPEFQRMVKESSGGLFDMVIVWKLDRFARNRYDSAHYKAVLRKNGVKVISATEAISDGAEGIILESVLEGYAEYYSAELSEKVIRGMTENALKCQYNGGYVPVGYKIDENKHYQVDELTAPFIKEAFLMYVNGRQVKDIVTYLNDNGVRSSQNKPIGKTTVTALLQNRKYIGEYSYRDVVVPNGVPSIISKELFALAMDRLEKNKYAPSSYKADERYLLTSKLMCGDCGALMVGEGGTSQSGKVYHYYKCVTAKKKGGCHRKAVRKDAIEELVMRKTVQSVFECNAMDSLVEHLMMWQAKENTAVPLLQRELQEVEKSLENMARAIEQGIINPTTKKRMDELTAQKTDLEVKIAREEIQTQILTREQVKFWLSKMIDLNLASQDNKQRIIDTFVNSIYVHDDRVIINFNCREESEVVPLQLNKNCSFLQGPGEPNWTNPKHDGASDFFVFYPGKPVFGLVFYL